MSPILQTDGEEFEALLEENLRGMRLLQIAFTAGVVLFGLVVVGLHLSREPRPRGPGQVSQLFILSMLHAMEAIACWVVGTVMFHAVLSPKRFARAVASGSFGFEKRNEGGGLRSPAAVFFERLRGAFIVRLALFEAPPLFGLVICMIGSMDESLREEPLYWLNTLSVLVLLLFAFLTFPTREKLMGRIDGLMAGLKENA